MYICWVCGNAHQNESFVAREMMFGSRDEFEYFECSQCGCLQIGELPADLSQYYPAHYYSFNQTEESRIQRFLKGRRIAHALGRRSFLGGLLVRRYGVPILAEWMRRAEVGENDAVLDVGCGAGYVLFAMRAAGFSRLTGIDPYVEKDFCSRGVQILKCRLEQIKGAYDLVMMHHSLEHMPDSLGVLRQVHRLLKAGGVALIRIPVAGSYAWRTYQTDWVQLDAPRHLFLHTVQSVQLLARKTGFEVADVVFDSTAFQFWGSEQYRRGIPLRDATSYGVSPEGSPFTTREIEAFTAKAKVLNRRHDGDQACFYLRKVSEDRG